MIRKLDVKDAQKMLDCLRDKTVTQFMKVDGNKMTIDNCLSFIKSSWTDDQNKHFAIIDDNDGWVGTISLKNVDYVKSEAEYAIITSSSVHGKGYAKQATNDIFSYAFKDLHLKRVYLNVACDNLRAISFYKKMGFSFVSESKGALERNGQIVDLLWFEMLNVL